MRKVALVFAAVGLWVGAANAQSLEQSYAQMCGEANKSTETCATLRKALIDKLSKESGAKAGKAGATAAATAEKPLTKAQKAKLAAPWGKWAELAGNSYDSGTMLRTYSWKVPYEILAVSSESPEGKGEAELTLSGEDILTNGKDPARKVSNSEYVMIGDGYRGRYVFVPDGRDRFYERLKDGQWVPEGEPERLRRVPASEVAMAKSRVLTARMQRDQEIEQQWGVVNRLVGKQFVTRKAEGASEDRLDIWKWVDRGRKVNVDFFAVPSGKHLGTASYERDPSTGSFFQRMSTGMDRVTISAQKIEVDGSKPENDGSLRTYVHEFDADGLKYYNILSKGGQRTTLRVDRMADVTGLSSTQIIAQASAQLSKRKQAVAQAQAAKARAEAEARAQAEAEAQAQASSDAGWLGALGGAIVGAFAGGNTEQVIGAAMKGAAIANPNSELAQGFDTAGEALITGDTSAIDAAMGSSPLGSLASSVGGASGSSALGGGGTAKAPVPMSGCDAVGINANNYQGADYSSGNDVQLKTMCAAAYSYYTAYENALGQGLSADDAEPAYQSHAKAAAVANQFYSEARAD